MGQPATGTWNTTPGGAIGALITLGAEIAIDFDLAATALSVGVQLLLDAVGAPDGMLLLAFAGANLVAFELWDPLAVGDREPPADTLAIASAGITRAGTVRAESRVGVQLGSAAVPSRRRIGARRFSIISGAEGISRQPRRRKARTTK